MSAYCQQKQTRNGVICNHPASFIVTYFSDGTGAETACARHLVKAVDAVSAGLHIPARAAVRVTRLSTPGGVR